MKVDKFSTMLARLVFTVLLVRFAVSELPKGQKLPKNMRNKNLRIRDLKADIRGENGKAVFSHRFDAVLEIAGLSNKRIEAKLLNRARLPSLLQTDGDSMKILTPEKKETAYYIGPDVSIAATAKKRMGKYESEMIGLVRAGKQNCFWKKNRIDGTRAFCSEVVAGFDVVKDPVTGQTIARKRRDLSRESIAGRRRRNIVEPSDQTRVIKMVVFCAKGFVDRFRAINNGDYALAVADIEEYVILLSNEFTYAYQTVLQHGGPDLSVHTLDVIVPPEDQEFSFVRKTGSGTISDTTLDLFGQNSQVRQLTDYNGGVAHHAMLLVGDPIGQGTLGIAYLSTVCRYWANGYRVDMTRDLDWNAANIGAHEIGHAMGAVHDGDNSCHGASFLMAAYAFTPTLSTKDTAFTFSPCSAAEFTTHITQYDPQGTCLTGKYTDFVSDFCLGPRGRLSYISLNEQCERAASPSTGYTICGSITKVTAEQCWTYDSVQCCNGGSTITIKHIADGTPCSGSNSALAYYCHRGQCELGDSICGTIVTPNTTTPTTTTTTSTTTTTTPTTTTTTPTTTTTTPTTTTTTPTTTTTTTPTTTTTTPTTTTTTTPTTTTTTPTTTTTTPTTTTTTTPTTTTTTPTTTTTTPTTTTTTPTTTTTTTPATTTTAAVCPFRWRILAWYLCSTGRYPECC